ncbi:MAG: deoxyuridine 5'-triphosphate nucleotidohydrolase [Chloroflexi bacterium RBG_16_50_11]|nr:MAG: deoxyuridine 5'-triphosphate nucleotidohydrolase [Chloroflexi bacterium RBG_16_50_11]
MPVLSSQDIRRLLKHNPPLVEGWLNLDEQVQANGFDLTLRDVAEIKSAGTIAVSNSQRILSDLAPLSFDANDFLELAAGIYMVTYNEIVHLPKNIMALGRPRSSLLRCGVNVGTAVWDAGYEGRSQSLLVVHNPKGFRVQKNARVTQLVFMELSGESEGYNGVYQRENI